MNTKKAASADRQNETTGIDLTTCSSNFLDPEVRPDGKRRNDPVEVTPETIEAIVQELPASLGEYRDRLHKESVISDQVIDQREYRRIGQDRLDILKRLGFSEKHGPALMIPIKSINGGIVSCQLRFDDPVESIDSQTQKMKKLRYLSPSGLDQRIDFVGPLPKDQNTPIWITEGCKKADALRSIGLYSIALTGVWNWSAKKARKDLQPLDWENRKVIIAFDSDISQNTAILKAETALSKFLKELGAEVQVVRIPMGPDGQKQGIDDYLANGGNLETLTQSSESPIARFISDDLDAAESLADDKDLIYSGNRFWRYSPSTGIWIEVPDESIKRAIQIICRSAAKPVSDSFIRGAFNQAKSRFFKTVAFDQIDPRSVPVLNGVLKYVDGIWTISAYNREDYRRIRLPIIWNPSAKCPRFEQFIEEVFTPLPESGESGKRDALQKIHALLEFMGLSLTATTEFEKALLMIGNGGNGKSVMIRLLTTMIGVKNQSAVQMNQLANRFQRAHMDGKIVNVMSELPEGSEIPDAELKAIISGESITAEHKLKAPFEFVPIAKLWVASNHMPGTRDLSAGLFRRFIILKFENRFDDLPSRDTRLSEKLATETSGILNHVLRALAEVFDRGELTQPESSKLALEAWRKDADQAALFVEERATLSSTGFTSSSALYAAYQSWAKESGIRKPLGSKGLTQRLTALGAVQGKQGDTVRGLYGIQLLEVGHGTF